MRPSHAVTRLALTGFGGIAALACGLSDVFRSSGLEAVALTSVGDTVLTLGDTVPFSVTVEAAGIRLSQPHLRAMSSDTARIALTAGLDSLIARRQGTAALTIQVESSMLTDTAPTLVQPLRVKP